MFSDKQREEYSTVRAPALLEAKVLKSEKNTAGKMLVFPRKTAAAVAACLAVVIAIGSYFSFFGSVEAQVVAAPYQTASLVRLAEEKIPVRLDVRGRYEVSVSQGSICADGLSGLDTLSLEGECKIEWLAPAQGEPILTVKKGLIIRHYRLCYNSQTNSRQLERV